MVGCRILRACAQERQIPVRGGMQRDSHNGLFYLEWRDQWRECVHSSEPGRDALKRPGRRRRGVGGRRVEGRRGARYVRGESRLEAGKTCVMGCGGGNGRVGGERIWERGRG